MLPVLKEIVEILFGKGFVKLLFATETFAVGINMPTKTVVFTGYRKYDEATGGQRMLNTDEYIQMAGRAGRRGKDDKGLVLYLPSREPEGLAEVQRMMTGARSTFQSRMTFHYEFLLKTLQADSLDWIKLMRQSYWYKRHELYMSGISAELVREEKRLESIALKPEEIVAMEERNILSLKLNGAVNAAKKEAQKAWSAWENGHMGPRWQQLVKELWPAWQKTRRDISLAKQELLIAEDPSQAVWPSLHALAAMGFLEEPAESLKLTPLGILATEVNEGHAVLMAQTYQRGLLNQLGAEEILAVLMAFTEESGKEMPTVDSLDIPKPMAAALRAIRAIGGENEKLEQKMGAPRPPRDSYWELNTTWVEPIWRWLHEGATVQDICAEYECYEGNLMRLLAKCSNLLEEWRSLATLSKDTEMLEKMRGLEVSITRGTAVCDSLYLRL